MLRTIMTILLFCLTLWPHNGAFALNQKFKPSFVTTIKVTSPKLNEVYMQGEEYFIRWKTFGKKPETVKIVLLEATGNTRVHTIKESIQNTGWILSRIPKYTAPGQYKIQVRVPGTRIYGRSEIFTISKKLKAKPVDLSSKQVIVTHPGENRKYPPGSGIPIRWETDIPKSLLKTGNVLYFDIDLYDKNGTTKIFTIEKDIYFKDYLFKGNKYRKRWSWKPDQGNQAIKTGQYKIKVSPIWADKKPAGMPGFSNSFHLSRGVETVTTTLKPVIRNRHSQKVKFYNTHDNYGLKPVPQKAENRPGTARVGHHNTYWTYGAEYNYWGFVFRSQLTFPVERFKEPGKVLVKAELLIEVDHNSIDYRTAYKRKTCSKAIYYMTGPWSGKCTDTPGYRIKYIPDESEIVFDITQWAQNWYTGSEPNHGLLLVASNEKFEHDSTSCVTWYKAKLVLEFLRGNTN